MARKNRPKILTASELLEMAQKAETDVIYERTQLQIKEMQGRHTLRMDLLDRLRTSADVTVQDVLEKKHGAPNVVQLRDLTKVPKHIARAVKKVKVTTRTDAGGATTQTVEVELAHHLDYDEMIGRYLGIFHDSGGKHVHLHPPAPAAATAEKGAPIPAKLCDLPPDQVRMIRARLEKEVEALSVTNSPEEPKK